MNKAFVDTTIIADALLKERPTSKSAIDALNRFQSTELPVYAIKEFKAGPLKYFTWFHNKLALLGSFTASLKALQRMSLTPKRYTTATAIEALMGASARLKNSNQDSLLQKYGQVANIDVFLCDQYRLALKAKIIKAWRHRRRITTNVVCPLSCYKEVNWYVRNRLIMLDPTRCEVQTECCLAPELKKRLADLVKLRNVIRKQSKSRENERRARALRELIRKPKALMSEKICRDLGDAYFALFAPQDSVILTTNAKDHKVLAEALGKKAETP